MKNSTILKDELSLLNENRSAVITEMRRASKDLDEIYSSITKASQELADVLSDKVTETARLSEIQGRVVLCKEELVGLNNELSSMRTVTENYRVKNAQEIKLHLGRVKELEDRISTLLDKIDELKVTHDKNYEVLANSLSDLNKRVRQATTAWEAKEIALTDASKKLLAVQDEEKKLLKDRLKREDKIRIREKMVDMRNEALQKREEDSFAMTSDLKILYARMKALYAKVDPLVDLDKLITQPE